jgi:hypothetical protein
MPAFFSAAARSTITKRLALTSSDVSQATRRFGNVPCAGSASWIADRASRLFRGLNIPGRFLHLLETGTLEWLACTSALAHEIFGLAALFGHGFENPRPVFFSGAPGEQLTSPQQHFARLIERLEFQSRLEPSYGIFKVLLEVVTQPAFVKIAHLENRFLNGSTNAKQLVDLSTLSSAKD